MSVVDEPAAATEPRILRDNPPARHLGRAAGIELLGRVDASGYKAGAALVRRADGQMVQLGPLLYTLLECIDGERSLEALVAALSDRLGRRVEQRHVVALAEKLGAQGLLAGTEAAAPPKANPLLALRWKRLVSSPKATRRLTRPFTFLFRPWILAPILAGFAATLWFVVIEKGVASATAQAFERPGLLLLITALVVLSAGFHELGHAAACRYGGATPRGMGVGLYIVWPAFYTDVTDAYRLPRRSRLRVDLGGLYFNTIVAVATMGAWLLTGVDALLLVVALQVVEMVKQLSPVIRADGYHILADVTGVPDLFAHIGPTLCQLLPGRNEPSRLRGRARVIVTLWVLVVVPVLAAMAITAILVLPRVAASAWASGSVLFHAIPRHARDGDVVSVLTSVLKLVALTLPVLGSITVAQQVVRRAVRRGRAWSAGSPPRTAIAALAGVAALGALAWAWWPDDQYRPVRGDEDWTLAGLVRAAARGATPAVAADKPPQLAPGKHLAVAMIPRGGATKARPALFVIRDPGRTPVAVISPKAPPAPRSSSPHGAIAPASGAATTTPAAPPAAATTAGAAPAQASDTRTATAFPFKLPDKPRPGDTQAVATGKTDGGLTYDIAYAVVTVKDGADVTQRNSAYALASCKACTTVAVSFQVVLVVGQSDVIAPVNVAEALNVGCPSCITAAFATQLVISLKDKPTPELVQRLQQALERLDGIPSLDSTDAISKELADIQREINNAVDDSGLRANPPSATNATDPPPVQTPATTTPATATSTTPTNEQPEPAAPTPPSQTTPAPPGSTATPPGTTAPASTTTTPATTAPAPTTTTPAGTSTTPGQTTSTSTTTTTTP
jgi:putative peptide zinc metalloprotease protein